MGEKDCYMFFMEESALLCPRLEVCTIVCWKCLWLFYGYKYHCILTNT